MGAFSYLKQYSAFISVDEMDKNVEQHMEVHRYNLTNSEREIVFALASHSLTSPGACHLKADTIADRVGVSRRTVMTGIKKLVELQIIERIPSTKMNGIKGANIYKILPYNNFTSETSHQEIDEELSNQADYEHILEVPITNSFNLLKSKQANNIIQVSKILAEESVNKKAYMNEWQVNLYELFMSLPIKDELKDQLHKAVLASDIANVKEFVRAKDALLGIIRDINDGILTVSSTLRAVFAGAYSKSVERLDRQPIRVTPVEDNVPNVKPVPFYNWLVERADYR